MGRKSILSEVQWAQIATRMMEGEAARALAAEFKISEAAIRANFKRAGKKPTVQKVAHMIADASAAMDQLPPSQQQSALNLAGQLRSISLAMAAAAENSAKTALRLTALANSEVQKVDDAEPMKNVENLRNAVTLTKAANEAAHIPLNLIAANKEAVKRFGEEAETLPDELTPERLQEGVRRLAFILHKAAATPQGVH